MSSVRREKLKSDIRRKQIRAMLAVGCSWSNIAKQLGISYKHAKLLIEQEISEAKEHHAKPNP